MDFPWETEEEVSSSVFQTRRKRHMNCPPQQLQKSLSLFHVFCKEMTSRRLQLRWRTWRKYVFLLIETAALTDPHFVCLTESAVHILKPKPTLGVQFSFHFVCPAFYDLSDHQVHMLKVKHCWSLHNLFKWEGKSSTSSELHFQLSGLIRHVSCLVTLMASLPKIWSNCWVEAFDTKWHSRKLLGKWYQPVLIWLLCVS